MPACAPHACPAENCQVEQTVVNFRLGGNAYQPAVQLCVAGEGEQNAKSPLVSVDINLSTPSAKCECCPDADEPEHECPESPLERPLRFDLCRNMGIESDSTP